MNTLHDCALIVFAKAPVPGFAKTRLIPALGAEGASRLSERLIDHALRTTSALPWHSLELCVTPDHIHPFFVSMRTAYGVALTIQQGSSLGVRMYEALSRALRTHCRVLLIGTDAPGIDQGMLRRAAGALDRNDAVFIPAHDGGYALVGVTRELPGIFADMPWGTAMVMPLTRYRLGKLGCSWLELAPLHDIDEPADLAHLPPELKE